MDGFEWDEPKASSNRLKHGVHFADAAGVFEDPHALTIQDSEEREERFVTMGVDYLGRVLVVVYTWRGEDIIRIISAREATTHEEDTYLEGRR